jgi:HK97 gp10 family phage protein
MSSPTSIKLVYGLDETKKDLMKLRRNIRRNVLRRAVRAGAVVIQKEARRRVPVRTGALKKAIAVRSDNTPYGVRGMVYISSRVKMRASAAVQGKFVSAKQRGFAGTIYPKAYAHLVEYGAQPHYLGRGSQRSVKVKRGDKWVRQGGSSNESGRKHPGARAQPFIRPAYDTKKEAAVEAVTTTLRVEIAKEIAKGNGSKRRKPAGVR